METLFLDESEFEGAARLVRDGKIVVFPTETVYGLGADATNPAAVASIYRAKGRPGDNPLIVHLPDAADLHLAGRDINEATRALVAAFCPGPLTVIVRSSASIAPEARAGLETVGIRIPSMPLSRRFLGACGRPVAAPSANRSGRPSPTSFEMSKLEMDGRAAAILRGPDSEIGLESTIVWAKSDREIFILRPGAVSRAMLRRALDAAGLDKSVVTDSTSRNDADLPRAPGTRHPHYSPNARVILFETLAELDRSAASGEESKSDRDALIIPTWMSRELADSRRFTTVLELGSIADYAAALYRALAAADMDACTRVFAWLPPEADDTAGIRDRLRRASGN